MELVTEGKIDPLSCSWHKNSRVAHGSCSNLFDITLHYLFAFVTTTRQPSLNYN